jgi:hypothetical protein
MFQLPVSGRLFRKLQPGNNWGWPEILLNKATYLLEVLAWQNTKDAQKGRTHTAPKMYTPDFLKNAEANKGLNPDQELHTVDEVKNILAMPRKSA